MLEGLPIVAQSVCHRFISYQSSINISRQAHKHIYMYFYGWTCYLIILLPPTKMKLYCYRINEAKSYLILIYFKITSRLLQDFAKKWINFTSNWDLFTSHPSNVVYSRIIALKTSSRLLQDNSGKWQPFWISSLCKAAGGKRVPLAPQDWYRIENCEILQYTGKSQTIKILDAMKIFIMDYLSRFHYTVIRMMEAGDAFYLYVLWGLVSTLSESYTCHKNISHHNAKISCGY